MTSADAKAATRASHDYIDHTSEVTIRMWAATYEDLFAETARAFTGLVPVHLRGEPSDEWKTIVVRAPDRAGALVDFVNELVYLAEVDSWVPEEVRVRCAHDLSQDADIVAVSVQSRGRTLCAPFVLVKAATLHGAAVHDEPDGCRGEVTLDI